MKHCIVAGGGYRGILSALLLARGGARVTLVESGAGLGGVLRSLSWNGFDLDLGCHLFDNRSDEETDLILGILGDEHHPVRVRYASKFLGRKSEGLAVPCLAGCDPDAGRTMLYESLVAAGTEHSAPSSLAELLEQRYGPTAQRLLAPAVRKAYRADPAELDPESLDSTVLTRVALFEDPLARTLKHIPAVDRVLAARSDHDPLLYHRDRVQRRAFRNFYPSRGGMGGFCERATALLEAHGVTILYRTDLLAFERLPSGVRVGLRERDSELERVLHADQLVWSLGLERLASLAGHGDRLASLVHGVPMALYYFTLEESAAGPYSYVHDFDSESLVFRASCPGNYGRLNRPPGKSYLCCEVPLERDGPVWNDPHAAIPRVWAEARALGMTDAVDFTGVHTMKVPSSYRVLRRGYTSAAREFAESFPAGEQVAFSVNPDTTKTRIYDAVRASLVA